MADLHDAVGLLEAGDWEAAHLIAQDDASTEGSWAHAIVHLLEGDTSNADYWYRQAGRQRPPGELDVVIAAEVAALRAALA